MTTNAQTANPDSSVARRINGERLVLAGWSRAILLQMAHPLVAAGVADHSSFRTSPRVAVERLRSTIQAMLRLTFGTAEEHTRTVASILAIHKRVRGTLPTATGVFPAGAAYTAEAPELVLWVHATLIDSTLMAYRALVGPVPEADANAYCAEAATVAVELGATPADVPDTTGSLDAYLTRMYASGEIAVGEDARAIAAAVLAGPVPVIGAPAAWVNRQVTSCWLPSRVRADYGLPWSARHDRVARQLLGALRLTRRGLPDRVARWPAARNSHR